MTKLATDKLVDEHFRVDEEDIEGQPIPNFSGTGGLIKPAENLIDPTVNEEDEIISERTERTKTYKLEEGKRRTIAASPKAHYKNYPSNELEQYKEVNLTLQEKNDRYVLPQRNGQSTAPFELAIYKHQIGYIIEDKQGGTVSVQLDRIENTNIDSEFIEQEVIRSVGGNTLYWSIPKLDLSIRVVARPEKVETWKTIQNENAPRTFQWIVEETKDKGRYKFQKDRVDGHDNEGDQVELHDETSIIEEKNEFIRYKHKEEFTGRAAKIDDPETRSRSWQPAKYPVDIDPSTSLDITADIDDGVGQSGSFKTLSLEMGDRFGGTGLYPGVRFRSLGINQGATIDSATLEVYVNAVYSITYGGNVGDFYADDVDNAAQWSNSDRPEQISKTNNSFQMKWTSTGLTQGSATNVVQEIISRSGWSKNNDIRFAGFYTVTGNSGDYALADDYSDSSPDVATLSVTYTTPKQLVSNKFPGYGTLNWSITASNITVSNKDGILADVSGSALTITLPGSPETGDVVAIKDYLENASTNNITVDRNGNNIDGLAENLTIDIDGAGVRLAYSDSSNGWEIVSEV